METITPKMISTVPPMMEPIDAAFQAACRGLAGFLEITIKIVKIPINPTTRVIIPKVIFVRKKINPAIIRIATIEINICFNRNGFLLSI